ncbi:MAG TPA: GDSL-type esterase/lipase family protein [Chloroflexia bacterium]|nr:GDSL-type esterase/lipase family protein [Chloroflexia bacterium]
MMKLLKSRQAWLIVGLIVILGFVIGLSELQGNNKNETTPAAQAATNTGSPARQKPLTPDPNSPLGDEYLALGDSVAYGVGASPPEEAGYAGVFYNQYLKKIKPQGFTYKNLGIPGETTTSFLSRGKSRSQLDNALTEIDSAQKAGRRVSPITLTIGANDVIGARGLSDDGKAAALEQFQSNLKQILEQLTEHTGGKSDIIVTTYYNPFAGNSSLADEATWMQRFNDTIRQTASDFKMKVADFYTPVAGKEQSLTWIGNGDIHPNKAGHALLAQAIWQASGYANLKQ